MPPVNTELLFSVLDRLEQLDQRFIIVGGAIVGLLVDQPELIDFRPTKDVDSHVGARHFSAAGGELVWSLRFAALCVSRL